MEKIGAFRNCDWPGRKSVGTPIASTKYRSLHPLPRDEGFPVLKLRDYRCPSRVTCLPFLQREVREATGRR